MSSISISSIVNKYKCLTITLEKSRLFCSKIYEISSASFKYIAELFKTFIDKLSALLNFRPNSPLLSDPSLSQPLLNIGKSNSLEFPLPITTPVTDNESAYRMQWLDVAATGSSMRIAVQTPLVPTLATIEHSLQRWIEGEGGGKKEEAAKRIREAFINKSTSLSLEFLKLTSLPKCVGYLKLQTLKLNNNNFEGVPKEIESIESLVNLNLKDNQIRFYYTWCFPKLKSLNLSGNVIEQFLGPTEQFLELQELNLTNALCKSAYEKLKKGFTWPILTQESFSTTAKALENLPNLKTLDLSNNSIADLSVFISAIEKLSHLEKLDLSMNLLERWIMKSGNKNLKILILDGNKFREIPQSIHLFERLEKFSIQENMLEDVSFSPGTLTHLTHLNLRENRIVNLTAGIGQLASLKILHIGSNKLSALPREIGNLPALEELYLFDNVLQELPQEMTQLLNLQCLSLSNNKLRSLPVEIGNLSQLTSLDVSENFLSTIPDSIGMLVRLKKFEFQYNELETIPETVGQMQSLELIKLHSNMISRLPDQLGNLSNLQILLLTNNKGLQDLPQTLQQCPTLTGLITDGTLIPTDQRKSILASCSEKRKDLNLISEIINTYDLSDPDYQSLMVTLAPEQKFLFSEWILLIEHGQYLINPHTENYKGLVLWIIKALKAHPEEKDIFFEKLLHAFATEKVTEFTQSHAWDLHRAGKVNRK